MNRIAAVLTLLAIIGTVSLLDRRWLLEQLVAIIAATEAMGHIGMLLYAIVYIIATLMLVPTTPLDMAAGLLFVKQYGLVIATSLSLSAKVCSGCTAFLLGRTLLRQYVKERLLPSYPAVDALVQAVETDAFRMTFMIRCAPIPTIAKSLCLAVSGVPIYVFCVASALFGAPWSLAGIVAGSSLASLPEILDGKGEDKLKEMMQIWKDRPGVMSVGVGICVAFSVFAGIKLQGIYTTYKGILHESEASKKSTKKD